MTNCKLWPIQHRTLSLQAHLQEVLDDLQAARHVRHGHGHVAVKPARTGQSRIKRLAQVGGRHHNDVFVGLQAADRSRSGRQAECCTVTLVATISQKLLKGCASSPRLMCMASKQGGLELCYGWPTGDNPLSVASSTSD